MALHRRRVRLTGPATAMILGMIGLLAACTQPGPTVAPQPPDRGIVNGVEVAPSAGCTDPTPGAPPVGRSVMNVPWQGGTRTALVDVPDVDGLQPLPVLLSLHPFTMNPEPWDVYSGMAAAATARGYAVLTPLGSDPGPRWAVPGGLMTEFDDIGFVSGLLDRLEDTMCIDRNREFAAGFSAGAAMAQALSCTLPWRISAVAGSGGTNLTGLCPDSPGTDAFILHGTADPIAPITGSTVVFAPPLDLPVSQVVSTNAARAGCATTPDVTLRYPTVEELSYTGCTEGRRVLFWKMLGTGHSWAGTTGPGLGELVGPTNTDFSATQVVLDFFDDIIG